MHSPSIVHSLYCALIYLVFSWLCKEMVKGLSQLEKVIISLRFVNTNCDHFHLFIMCGWSLTNYYWWLRRWKHLENSSNAKGDCQILTLIIGYYSTIAFEERLSSFSMISLLVRQFWGRVSASTCMVLRPITFKTANLAILSCTFVRKGS